jgi:hypothetical protein
MAGLPLFNDFRTKEPINEASIRFIRYLRFDVLTDVTHGAAKLALHVKASLDTPKQIAEGRQQSLS